MKLDEKVCIPCSGLEPQLADAQINKYIKKINSGWKLEKNPNKIVKEFTLKDFRSAVSFVNKIANIAESQGHHPNIYIHSYNKVRIELWTHKIRGLHENDFILAAKIDKLGF